MPPEAAAAAAEDQIDEALIDDAAPGADDEPKSSAEAIRVASLMGWKDPSKWQGDPPPGGLKTAEEYLAEVPDVLKNTRKKAERLEGQVTRIVSQVAKLDRASSHQADASAKAAAREAMEAGDFDKAEKILTEARSTNTAPDKPPALAAFEERNADWYGVDDEATAYTEMLDKRYAQQAGGVADPDAHMRKVEAGVKKAFPHLFDDKAGAKDGKDDTPARRAPFVGRGGGVDRSRRGPGEMTVADMTPAQRRAAETMGVKPESWVKNFNLLNKDA
jgi:hypothetical protein